MHACGGETKMKTKATINGMVETNCPNCGKPQYTFLKGMRGEIATVYCSKLCETEHKNPHLKQRFKNK